MCIMCSHYIGFWDYCIGNDAIAEFIWILNEVYLDGQLTVVHLRSYWLDGSNAAITANRIKFIRSRPGDLLRPFDVYCFVCGATEASNVFNAVKFYRDHTGRHG